MREKKGRRKIVEKWGMDVDPLQTAEKKSMERNHRKVSKKNRGQSLDEPYPSGAKQEGGEGRNPRPQQNLP